MVSSINAFTEMFRAGHRYANRGFIPRKISGANAYVLNKPMDERDAVAYHQTPMADGTFLVFIGRQWSTAARDKFLTDYNNGAYNQKRIRQSSFYIPTWRRTVLDWLHKEHLQYSVDQSFSHRMLGDIIPIDDKNWPPVPELGFMEPAYNHKKWRNEQPHGWTQITISFEDNAHFLQYKSRICHDNIPWGVYMYRLSNDRGQLPRVVVHCNYENNYVSKRDQQRVILTKADDVLNNLNVCLWCEDVESCKTWYEQYTGYLSQINGRKYYKWGTSPFPDMSTYQFLRQSCCRPITDEDDKPISVRDAVNHLEVNDVEDE